MRCKKILTALILFSLFVSTRAVFGQIEMTMKTWGNNDAQFAKFNEEVAANHDLNLLAFPGAKLVRLQGANEGHLLIDGSVGELGSTGRVSNEGSPSSIVYYLGKPRSILEIAVCTGNIDQRGNQDFEIRLANNEANPGKMPTFTSEPTLTSGDKVIGNNGGGVRTAFTDANGKLLFDGKKFDWIEFKIWRTYPNGTSGAPAKSGNRSNSWASVLELEVLADPSDPNLFASEAEKNAWIEAREAAKFQQQLNALGEDIAYAMKNPISLRRAIEDLSKRYPDSFDGKKYILKYEEFEKRIAEASKNANDAASREKLLTLAKEFDVFRREVLLSNPLLSDFDEMIIRRAQNAGLTSNWISNCARGKGGYGNALISVKSSDFGGEAKVLKDGPKGSFIGDINLHWDADKMLVTALSENSNTWQVFELNTDGTGMKQITPEMGNDVDNVEGCFIPDGSTVFVSSATMMGVPCISGSSPVGNIYRVEKDGKTVRQLTFEQDQDWCPVLMHNGRVMYLRWEYTDIAHYFSRIMFSMNPDGTNQIEHYGSGSFWPNSLFYAKPIPGHPTKFCGIVTGHHGVSREGELVVFDPALGRKEADGVVQRIPGFGQPVEPIIVDQLVDNSWPKFLFPAPLDENYYIVSCRMSPSSKWCIYLVDTFDNMLKLREEPGYHLLEPTPLVKREQPTMIPSRVIEDQPDANVFIADIYFGDGLKDIPRGTVKKLRIFEYSFGYRGIGGHDLFGVESCWDARRILGEVPVYEDGSASFVIPANKPVAFHPLDEDGRAVQIMRSWFVAMPGENASCAGCHESQNAVVPAKRTIAMTKPPVAIEPFLGPERPFSFTAEIQPILNKYCSGCHDGSEDNKGRPNFADSSRSHATFSASYHALHPYVRRPGPESDMYMLKPMEYHTSTSELFQMLEKGHHGVEIDRDSMRILYAWADLNVPYHGTWLEVAEAFRGKGDKGVVNVSDRYVELKKLYTGNDLNYEADSYYGFEDAAKVEFVKPKKTEEPDFSAPKLANWPFNAATAKKMQGANASQKMKVGSVEFELFNIPKGEFVMGDAEGRLDELPRTAVTIEKPFWMMSTEVTNALYAEFDPGHDSRFIDQWWKDHTTPGYPANKPEQPAIRVSWNEAVEFCKWLSGKTGKTCRLPTEAEWEWASRAGTGTPMWYGELDADFAKFANLSDFSTRRFYVRGVNPQPVSHQDWQAWIPRVESVNDGQMYAEKIAAYDANPWGLYDMHGSVAEWTQSDYKPYPYNAVDGRNAGDPETRKVVRGGSWNERPKNARSGFRLPYEPWQKIHNVGFRVVVED